MKVLLAAINSKWTHTNPAVLYLEKSIGSHAESVIKEFSINQNIIDILYDINKTEFDAICLSVYIWNSVIISQILPEIKKLRKNTVIILGGPEVSYNAEDWLQKFPTVDYIISGQGESVLTELVKNGLKNPEKIISKKNPHFNDIPFIYDDDYLENNKNKYLYYESSRGCPFKCPYCISSRTDIPLEFRDIYKVITELDFITDHDIKILKFIDRSFNVNKQHYRKIWEHLITKNNTVFHFEIFPSLLDDDDYYLLKNIPSGKFQFEIGLQSTNPETLEYLDRKYYWEDIYSKILKLVSLKTINIHLDLIAGLPFENFETFQKSFNHVYSLHPNHLQLGFLKVLPGTKIFNDKLKYEIEHLDTPPYTILKNNLMSVEELRKLNTIEEVVESFHNTAHFPNTLNIIINNFDNAFHFYLQLREYLDEQNYSASTINWEKNARILEAFSKNITIDIEAVRHNLRIDWLSKCYGINYPEFLHYDTDLLTDEIIKNMKHMKKSEKSIKNILPIIESGKYDKPSSKLSFAVFYHKNPEIPVISVYQESIG